MTYEQAISQRKPHQFLRRPSWKLMHYTDGKALILTGYTSAMKVPLKQVLDWTADKSRDDWEIVNLWDLDLSKIHRYWKNYPLNNFAP